MDNIGNAVDQLIELVDDENSRRSPHAARFYIHSMEIVQNPEATAYQDEWIVRARDSEGKAFPIAMYIDHRGHIEADGVS